MSLKSHLAKRRQRRLDLAINQIQNPTGFDETGMNDAMQPQVRASRAAFGAMGRLTKASSKTEWKGD
jgi:hypothetical protein